MKKLVPAVYFQKRLDGADHAVKKPEMLELYESQLRAVTGAKPSDTVDTFSYSSGWLDVLQPDDCGG